MSKSAQRKRPVILVSEDYDPDVWRTLDEGESEFQAWVAVAQDIWGRGCYAAGQADAVREGSNGLTINKAQIIGAAGCAVGGLAPIAKASGTHIEVFESDPAVLAYAEQDAGAAGKFLKLAAWDPARPELKAGRYHGFMALRALSAAADPLPVAAALANTVKPGGRLFVDELYAPDPSVAALVAQAIAAPGQKMFFHPHATVMDALAEAKLESRSKANANEQLLDVVRKGLARSQDIAQQLKAIPQPFRKPRMTAFADELQRAAILHQALEKGLVTAIRTIHYKARDL
jgi:SAM-dependent methyltransferase